MVNYRDPYPTLDPSHMLGRDNNKYLADEGLMAAVHVALAVDRPLLLTGEPGCGKTDFAFAAARALQASTDDPKEAAGPLSFYVRSDTTARDLLYRYDLVRRFGDVQTGDEDDKLRARYPQNYISLEALSAGLISPYRRVVLIDEIDKASSDLPNDLLRELDQGWFEIPEITPDREGDFPEIEEDKRALRREMRREDAPQPLVIITSNVERQPPEAFLRRCVFYYIPFPDDAKLNEILSTRKDK